MFSISCWSPVLCMFTGINNQWLSINTTVYCQPSIQQHLRCTTSSQKKPQQPTEGWKSFIWGMILLVYLFWDDPATSTAWPCHYHLCLGPVVTMPGLAKGEDESTSGPEQPAVGRWWLSGLQDQPGNLTSSDGSMEKKLGTMGNKTPIIYSKKCNKTMLFCCFLVYSPCMLR